MEELPTQSCWAGRVQTRSRHISNPPCLYGQQVRRLAGTATPGRAPRATPAFLGCSGRREQGSMRELRGRQVYASGGAGSSCYCTSLGTSFAYSTAPLLTSCLTQSPHQAHVLPCLRCWNLLLPSSLSETH